jgi:hypothetical protein
LLHCRDIGTEEPFDFLGFLDYAPSDEEAFEDMLGQLRATREWTFFDRKIDIRLMKAWARTDFQVMRLGSAIGRSAKVRDVTDSGHYENLIVYSA